jgi:hypothetical protein|nr:MAG TPA: hypothetical protein [Caudoviricetes sp.]
MKLKIGDHIRVLKNGIFLKLYKSKTGEYVRVLKNGNFFKIVCLKRRR